MPSFPTIEAMSAYQEERELAEALRVQAMSPQELTQWLRDNWDPLQIQAASLSGCTRPSGEPRVRHFATLEAKNRYDEQREVEDAVQLAISRRNSLKL